MVWTRKIRRFELAKCDGALSWGREYNSCYLRNQLSVNWSNDKLSSNKKQTKKYTFLHSFNSLSLRCLWLHEQLDNQSKHWLLLTCNQMEDSQLWIAFVTWWCWVSFRRSKQLSFEQFVYWFDFALKVFI